MADVSNIIFKGVCKTVKLLSGREVEIREATGEDESVLSNLKSARDGDSTYEYLSRVVTEGGMPITVETIKSWGLNDIDYALLQARIISLGNEFVFPFTCGEHENCKKPHVYVQNLDEFTMGREFSNSPKPYPQGKSTNLMFRLSTGKEVTMELFTGETQASLLALPDNTVDKNTHFLHRKMMLKSPTGVYELVTHLGMFSSRELAELRYLLAQQEPTWSPTIDITCSNPLCGKRHLINPMMLPDFFFPTIWKAQE